MKKELNSILFIILGMVFNVSAQEVMNLPKAISTGLENNYDIEVADRFILIAENNDSWARAGRGPIIDLNGSFNNNLVNDNNPASFLQGTYYGGSLGTSLNVQWVLFSGGRIKIAKDRLGTLVDQEKLLKNTAIHDLLYNIYQQYYAVLFQQERKEVLQSSLDLSKSRLAYEQERRNFGATNSYNLIQFENAVISDSINLVNQTQSVEIAKRQLYNVLDIEGRGDYAFEDRLSIMPEEIEVERLRKILSEDNYTLKTLEMTAALNQINTKLEEANDRLSVSLSTSVGYNRNGFKFFAENENTGEPFPFIQSNRFNGNVAVNVAYNLYDGGVQKTNIQNAKIQEDIDQVNILAAKMELNNQLDMLIENYNLQKDQVFLADEQIQIASRNLEMTDERFKTGQVTSIDFRNVQVQFLNAAFNKVNTMYNLILAKSEIDYLVGRFN
jgi:outer membrane protein TolC